MSLQGNAMLEDVIQNASARRADCTTRPNKRKRYALVACEKCKKRKIRCSGETPCSQCAKHKVPVCVYDRLIPDNSTTSTDIISGVSILEHTAYPHPLWPLSSTEAEDLLETLREDIETLYPFIDLQEIKTLANIVSNPDNQPRNPESNMKTARWDETDDARNLDLLKLLLTCALSTKRNWKDDPSERFLSTVKKSHYGRVQCIDIDVKDVAIATILSVYDYRRDNVTLAWRKIGAAAKLCLELGLHRMSNPVLDDSNQAHFSWETKMFWCIYVLDRRYSFMANLPFTLQDRDIDFELLQVDRSAPYLIPMVMFGRLGGKIIPTAPKFGSSHDELNENAREDLGNQIDRWMETTAIETSSAQSFSSIYQNFSLRRLHQFNVFFKIRGNQMRLSLYKHSLYTPNSVLKHQNFARRAVQVATDNIRVLSETRDSASDLFESLSLHYYFFLTSSLVVLHLAIRNAPHQFSNALLEYSAGLNMLKSMSATSTASEKLRKTVQTLENALNGLVSGPVQNFGNILPLQLNYSMSPISMANSPANGNLGEATKRTDPNSRPPYHSNPLTPDISGISSTSTPQSSYSFGREETGKVLINEKERGQNVLQDFSIGDIGMNNFWNISPETLWNDEAMAGGELPGLPFKMQEMNFPAEGLEFGFGI